MSDRLNARLIVESVLSAAFTKGLPIRLDAYALSNQIIDSLDEVDLLNLEDECACGSDSFCLKCMCHWA
jgi:hypothetical protein